jgi:hypothetical protein
LAGGAPEFVDVTQQVLGSIVVHESSTYLATHGFAMMSGGGAVGDFNNDGWQDFLFLGGGDQADKLFINNQDGTFTDNAGAWGVDWSHMGIGASVGDFDGDGWLDIYVTSIGDIGSPIAEGMHRLYHNNGDGTFTDVAQAAGVHHTTSFHADGFGSTFGDYDLDGDLDLFVTGWWPNSDHNRLFQNNGDGTFTNVTAPAQLSTVLVQGFSPAFVDMNGDRYPELLLAADFGTSHYYINNGDGTFTDTNQANGTGIDANGMGHAIADFDGDGDLDWYVTSIHSEIDFADLPPLWQERIPGTGNMLYLNDGNHQFTELSVPAGVNDGGWGWGTVPVDIDHDGKVDLFETNGWTEPNAEESPEWVGDRSYVFRGIGGGAFEEIGIACGVDDAELGRGALRIDYDNDGDQDMIMLSTGGRLTVYESRIAGKSGASWIRIFLDTDSNNLLAPDGYGARVELTAGGQDQTGFMHAAPSYLSVSEQSVHFGLNTEATIDQIMVRWSNGTVTVRNAVPANQTLVIAAPRPGDVNESGAVDVGDITNVLKSLGDGTSPSDANGDGSVDVNDISYILFRLGS